MKDTRIHNDINVAWGIFHNGEPYSLEGKDVSLYLLSPYSRFKLKDFTIEGNKVRWTFYGKDQKSTGKYSLELVINEGAEGMVTTDYCNFVNLVAYSCKVGGADDGNVQTESIELTSTIEYIAGEGGGTSYDDTEIRAELSRLEKDKADKSELTELSAEVGKVSEDVANKVQKGSLATINGQSIENGGNIVIEGGQGGTSSDKQGVVSQTLNYNTADNTYSVSNVVRGSIPSFFIDLVTEAGASFNAESGYFSLNGIDNIAYDEMRQIYDCRTGYGCNSVLAIYGESYKARTTFPIFRGFDSSFANHTPTAAYCKYLLYKNASILTCAFCDSNKIMYVQADSTNNFDGASVGSGVWNTLRLEEIIGIIDVSNMTKSINFFYNGAHSPYLAEFKLKSLKASINISGMPRLSEASLLYMINNEKSTEGITIKLHADAKAMADASEAIQSALAAHTNITLGV